MVLKGIEYLGVVGFSMEAHSMITLNLTRELKFLYITFWQQIIIQKIKF